MAALIAGNYEGPSRKVAYAIIGGVAGAGIAIGPIVGGWATTELSWRVVFVGEVIIVIGILIMTPFVTDAPRSGPKPRLDVVGSVLTAVGFGSIVLAFLRAGTWGWVQPKDAPVEPFGFSPTLFLMAFGAVVLFGFVRWQRHRELVGQDPLVHLDLLSIPSLRAGLTGLFSQNLILMGIFFTIPLYLQVVLGLDALETGIKMLPVSIMMFIASAVGSRLSTRFSVRGIVRTGLSLTGLASLLLLGTVQPDLDESSFAFAMGVLGIGMGLIASQLGNVVQSSVDASGRGEAGGMQYTGQQLGSSIGVALIGGIVLTGLASGFVSNVQADERLNDTIEQQVVVAVEDGIDFVSADSVEHAATDAGLTDDAVDAIVEDYGDAQLQALKIGLLAAALLALGSLAFTANLPSVVAASDDEEEAAATVGGSGQSQ
jgi:MFS family permease